MNLISTDEAKFPEQFTNCFVYGRYVLSSNASLHDERVFVPYLCLHLNAEDYEQLSAKIQK